MTEYLKNRMRFKRKNTINLCTIIFIELAITLIEAVTIAGQKITQETDRYILCYFSSFGFIVDEHV